MQMNFFCLLNIGIKKSQHISISGFHTLQYQRILKVTTIVETMVARGVKLTDEDL